MWAWSQFADDVIYPSKPTVGRLVRQAISASDPAPSPAARMAGENWGGPDIVQHRLYHRQWASTASVMSKHARADFAMIEK
jgi:hypothetical protein